MQTFFYRIVGLGELGIQSSEPLCGRLEGPILRAHVSKDMHYQTLLQPRATGIWGSSFSFVEPGFFKCRVFVEPLLVKISPSSLCKHPENGNKPNKANNGLAQLGPSFRCRLRAVCRPVSCYESRVVMCKPLVSRDGGFTVEGGL